MECRWSAGRGSQKLHATIGLVVGLTGLFVALPLWAETSASPASAPPPTRAAARPTVASEPPGESSTHFDAKARAGKKDIVSTLQAEGHFETLLKAMAAAELESSYRTRAPLTMFVPNDAAFAKLPPGTLDRWLSDPRQLKQILRYHTLQAYVPGKQLIRLRNALTLQGTTVRLDSESSAYATTKVNTATVIRRDILASNGVLHETDAVLLPPERSESHDKKAGKKGSKRHGATEVPAEDAKAEGGESG